MNFGQMNRVKTFDFDFLNSESELREEIFGPKQFLLQYRGEVNFIKVDRLEKRSSFYRNVRKHNKIPRKN